MGARGLPPAKYAAAIRAGLADSHHHIEIPYIGQLLCPAIGAPPKQEIHLHLHGATAEDVAAILSRAGQVYGTFDEHPPHTGD